MQWDIEKVENNWDEMWARIEEKGLAEVIEPGDPATYYTGNTTYGVPNPTSGGISSSSPLGGSVAPDYGSRSSAMLSGAAFRSARRAAGILGIPSRTGPVQRVGSNYVSPLGPGLPGPPPPEPGSEEYTPSDPVLYPDDPRYEDYRPDLGDDHNMPGRRSSRARSLTR
jgi:hypothetical protein